VVVICEVIDQYFAHHGRGQQNHSIINTVNMKLDLLPDVLILKPAVYRRDSDVHAVCKEAIQMQRAYQDDVFSGQNVYELVQNSVNARVVEYVGVNPVDTKTAAELFDLISALVAHGKRLHAYKVRRLRQNNSAQVSPEIRKVFMPVTILPMLAEDAIPLTIAVPGELESLICFELITHPVINPAIRFHAFKRPPTCTFFPTCYPICHKLALIFLPSEVCVNVERG
jgi:hypothetical protein